MRAFLAPFAIAAMIAAPAFAQAPQAPNPTVGVWKGALSIPDFGDLPLIVRITETRDGLAGELESPAQNATMPIKVSEGGPKRLVFTVPSVEGSYTGTWDEAAKAWTGTWSQSGNELALVLRR
ncbi:hypothetical protein BH11PSE2_BH11PSE2_14540 [soil metagenome]